MIKIVAVGSIKEEYIRRAVSNLQSVINTKNRIEVCVVEDEKCPEKLSEKEKEEVKRKEAQRIERYIKSKDYVVALTLEGKPYQTQKFEKLVRKESVCFIIGGSLGLHEEIIRKTNEELSFGPMTYPHQLMRWVLLEKIEESLK